jgi:hypothetical protein
VTTVKIFYNDERPSTLPAACAQVPGSLTGNGAHAFGVGRPAVRGALIIEARKSEVQQIQGRTVATSDAPPVQGSVMVAVKRGLGDVRGVPPRGRPV